MASNRPIKDSPIPPASERIPTLILPLVGDKAKRTLDVLERFVEDECIPSDPVFDSLLGRNTIERFSAHPKIIEDLKSKAKSLGLWNLFAPKGHFHDAHGKDISAGYSNIEYGLMAEILGKSAIAPEVTNCAAPDTGNMEVLAKYGTAEQQARWLKPLLDGKIRSAFLMTEPDVASSDATNIGLQMTRDGDYWVLNGAKWWSSGAGDPRCEVYLVVGKTDPHNPDPYRQQSLILVPADTPGMTVDRMLSVFGYDDAPHGHGHITFENVRVHASNMVLGPGRGFEIMQGRLGPGRIHHAMRSVGAAERALEYLIARAADPRKKPFGTLLRDHGVISERIAKSRLNIDAARLIVCSAAVKIDQMNAKEALKEIAEAKVFVPKVLGEVVDWAIQAYGGAGVSQDTPLASMWAGGRTMRLVDGPDEIHLLQLGRAENKKGNAALAKIKSQKSKTEQLAAAYGVSDKLEKLALNRVRGSSAKL
ncbi:acyl-CoA dehydrogenase [Rhizodiscina lignyota]|uniref:Acyl-CoA dehydrogenase n=1 Tax=Rhizodiscina lignyota TaxID=1504668 RepID=A0A9P4M6C9_9PEZI|nr:acyl-CoA dehydrogenase [Rhizodiscina lignyota]